MRGCVHSIVERSSEINATRKGNIFMRFFALAVLSVLSWQVQAQEGERRFMLEAGLVGGNSAACPGRYAGIIGQVTGPVSLYGMVENYRCVDLAGSANRIGGAVRLGPASWLVRPALRAGLEYDGGNVSSTAGASLTFGRRYGARLILQVGEETGDTRIVLFQMGGYLSF